jgi:gamma-glutamylcyclotransferase (GGCT)/AIG2-like uncharacterized protein YtfP
MRHIFTYGSLMFEPVWSAVVRGRYQSSPATLSGFVRRCVQNEHYPVIYADPAAPDIDGVVYFDVALDDLLCLDRFEGEYYGRKTLQIKTAAKGTLPADGYILKDDYKHIATDEPWDPLSFRETGISAFLARYRGFGR